MSEQEADETVEDEALHPLARRHDERAERHRAWMLWLSQDPDLRSWRLVARAIGRDDSTVRKWRNDLDWITRTLEAGEGVQAMALALYRRDYLPRHGRLEMEAIRGNCSLDLAPGDPPNVPLPESVQEGRANPEQGTKKPGSHGGSKPRQPTHDEKVIKKGLVLADAAIAQFAKEIVSGKVKVRPRDLPFLVGFRRKLQRDLDIIVAGDAGTLRQGPAVIPESYRVKAARANGEDVLGAVQADAEDLVALLQAIRNQRVAATVGPQIAAAGGEDG